MPPDDLPRDALRRHRPLPSVDIPLLREERQAARHRRLARVGIVVTALALVIGGSVGLTRMRGGGKAPEPTPEPDPAAATALVVAAEPQDAGTGEPDAAQAQMQRPAPPSGPVDPVVETPFGKGHSSFRDAVESAGLSREESETVIAALEGVMDFRRCKPEDLLILERSADGTLQRFEYKAGLTQRYEAVRTEEGEFEGRQVEVPLRVVRIEKGGIVDGSLGNALEGLSLRRSLAGVFVEVFEGHVAFTTDTRTGDTFRVIVDEEYVEDTFLRYGTIHALEYRGQRVGTLRAFWYAPPGEQGDFYDADGRAMHGGWLRTPVRYDHISSPFGMRMHPVLKRRRLHSGLDYAAASGTIVRAAADGTVIFAGRKGANGNLIGLKHDRGFETYYAHLLRFARGIKRGVEVEQRQIIGYVGSTGRSTGPHLHFGLKKHGRFIDPASELNGPGARMARSALPAYRRHVRKLTRALERIPLETPLPADPPEELYATGDEDDDLL